MQQYPALLRECAQAEGALHIILVDPLFAKTAAARLRGADDALGTLGVTRWGAPNHDSGTPLRVRVTETSVNPDKYSNLGRRRGG